MILLNSQRVFKELIYATEAELETEVVNNARQLFGEKTIYFDVKRKLGGKSLGNTIPDGFLFDFSDPEVPAFYLVEVELAKHDFYRHIFPQITKFIGFFKNSASQSELIEKIHELILADANLSARFLKLSNNKELFKTVKDIIEDSQNILIIIDEDKTELKEIMDVYSDTWGKMVNILIFKRFECNGEIIFSLNQEFNDIEYSALEYVNETKELKPTVTEEFHFEKAKDNVKNIYALIKSELLKWNNEVGFNPQKYYISLVYNHNVAYFITRKSRLRLVIKENIHVVRNEIKNHEVGELSSSVQKFWGGDACQILLENTDNIQEIIDLLKKLLETDKNGE